MEPINGSVDSIGSLNFAPFWLLFWCCFPTEFGHTAWLHFVSVVSPLAPLTPLTPLAPFGSIGSNDSINWLHLFAP